VTPVDRALAWTRRTLLVRAFGTAIVALGLGCTRRDEEAPLEPVIAAVVTELERALAGVPVEPAALVAFARDLEVHRSAGRLRPLEGLDPTSRFLLSSDVFRRAEGDASRPIRYVGFYDPYLGPCRNPLPDRTEEEDLR
jgi:hypothetical protein